MDDFGETARDLWWSPLGVIGLICWLVLSVVVDVVGGHNST